MSELTVLGLCGSLRQSSINRATMRLAGAVMPQSMALDMASWRDIPIYDDDLKADGFPASVVALSDAIRRADGVIIASPEYNFSIPGGLKNAIDWISRVADQPFAMKPVAIMSASPGPVGGARMQYDLRKVLLFLNAMPLTKPEIIVGLAGNKFDADGRCTDETTRSFVTDQMQAFERWIGDVARLRGSA